MSEQMRADFEACAKAIWPEVKFDRCERAPDKYLCAGLNAAFAVYQHQQSRIAELEQSEAIRKRAYELVGACLGGEFELSMTRFFDLLFPEDDALQWPDEEFLLPVEDTTDPAAYRYRYSENFPWVLVDTEPKLGQDYEVQALYGGEIFQELRAARAHIAALERQIAEMEAARGEPVAYLWSRNGRHITSFRLDIDEAQKAAGWSAQPLYTAPPAPAVVLPEMRMVNATSDPGHQRADMGYNDALAEVRRLNANTVSAQEFEAMKKALRNIARKPAQWRTHISPTPDSPKTGYENSIWSKVAAEIESAIPDGFIDAAMEKK